MKLFSKKISLFFAALLVFVNVLQIPASAAVPNRPGNNSVLDSAGVLSDEFEQELNRTNREELFPESGAEIAVVTVDFLGGMSIDDYAYDLFISWGVGSQERNNGLLLVLAIAEDDYYAMPGYGIEDVFTGSHLQSMLDEYLEDDFAAGNYEAGVKKFVGAAIRELHNYTYNDNYGADYDADYDTDYGYTPHKESSGISLFSVLRVIFYIVVVAPLFILVIASIVAALFRIFSGGRTTTTYYDSTPQYRRRDNFWTGMFLGQALGRSRRNNFWTGMFLGQTLGRSRRRPRTPPPPPPPPGGFGGFNSPGPTNRPGGFSGGGAPQRPSSGFSSRPFSGGSSRPSGGGFSRPSSGSSRPSGGFSRGGGSRGGGAGRRK